MNIFRLTGALALSTTILTAAATAPAISQTIQVSRDNRTIAITATDKVTAIADMAIVHIGFIAYGPDSDWAYANGSRVSNGIMKALTDAGIPKESIESENQNVSPVPDFQNQKLTAAERAQRQFQVTQSWTVRTAADDAAKTLDLAVKAGANQSGQIEWTFKDENTPQAEAAAKALRSARAQAEQMATSLSARLGALLYASNEVQPNPIHPVMRAMAAPMAEKVEPLAINPRKVEKIATVYAVFAIQ
jgi:uncharacterized protein YggE